EPERRLVRRLARTRAAIGEARGAQPAFLLPLDGAGGERATRGAMRGLLRRAALGNPEMQLVGVEEIVATVDQGDGDAAGELEERRAVALGRPRRIEHADLRAHAPDQAA